MKWDLWFDMDFLYFSLISNRVFYLPHLSKNMVDQIRPKLFKKCLSFVENSFIFSGPFWSLPQWHTNLQPVKTQELFYTSQFKILILIYQSSFLQFFLKLDDVQMANSAFRNHASYSRHSGSVDTSPVSSCLNFRAWASLFLCVFAQEFGLL